MSTYVTPKLYVSSMDEIFRTFAVEPGLPDPRTYKHDFYEMILEEPMKGYPKNNLDSFDPTDMQSTFTRITFRKAGFHHPVTKRRMYFWVRADNV